MHERALVKRWWLQEAEAAASEVKAIVDFIEQHDSSRIDRAKNSASLYEGKRLGGLSPLGYLNTGPYSTDEYDHLRWNISRSQCQYVQAKVAGRGNIKVQFVVTDGDWSTKRRAVHLDRFVEGQMHLRQGIFENCWALARQAFMHAAVFGIGTVRVQADHDLGKVTMEIVPCWRIFVDPHESENGNPLSLAIVDYWDKDQLAAKYPEHSEKILAAKGEDNADSYSQGGTRLAEQVRVYEAWRLPVGPEDKGKYIRCIDGQVLEFGDHERDKYPLLFLHWSRDLMGFWAHSLVEESEDAVNALNETLQRMQDSERHTSKNICIYDEEAVDQNHLVSNEDCINIPKKPGSSVEFETPSPWGPETLEWVRLQREQAWSLPGVNEASAAARKESGVTSGVALRTVADMETERFSVIYRQFEQFHVELAEHIVECTRDLAEEDKDFYVKWPGKGFLREIRWEDVDLPEDSYQVQISAVSGMKNTATDRLQLAEDLYGAGQISETSYKQALIYLNTKDELGSDSKQRQVVAKYIEAILDATPEKQKSGEFQYRPPIPFMGLEDALLQMAEAYLESELDDVPDFNKDFFLRFMEECDMQIQQRAAKVAAIQAQATQGGAPEIAPAGSGIQQAPAAPQAA